MKGKSHTVVFNLFPTGTTHPLKPPSNPLPIVLWCFVYQCLFIFAWLHAFSGLPLARNDTLWPRPVLCGGGRVGRPGNICPYLAAETIEVVKKLLCGTAPGVKKIHPALLKALGIVVLYWLMNRFSVACVTGTLPVEWQTRRVVAIFKKGDQSVSCSHEGSCRSPPRLPFVSAYVCYVHGQNLKVSPKRCSVWFRVSEFC